MDPRLASSCGVALVALGTGALIAPAASSRGYGVPVEHAGRAYVRATGARDVILGAMVLWQLARAEPRGAATTLRFSTLAAVSDAATIAFTRGAARSRLAVHLGGLAVALVAAARLGASPADASA